MSFLDVTEAKEQSFEPIPKGEYTLQIENAEVKTTKAGTGEYINATMLVVGGEYDGRKLFTTYNIKNPNQVAVDIGMGQLKSMMKSAGRDNFQLQTVGDLCGLTFKANVKIKIDNEYGDKNEISSYKKYNELENTATVTPAFDKEQIPF